MYRLESYITSRILSYVDRYIKNFKRQDAQVSLWEGDGSLHNLDLDLEVLDQELNLPFSFVSGHIHELLIHVPWTSINSEPVRVTINTIECIMKLKPPGQESGKRKKRLQSSGEENIAPPSYVSSLVNKVICNLSVTCNNIILKYVEEDIVLSMNIKTLSLNTVNSRWNPEVTELSAAQLILRNLISLTDVTVCLDRRNASGRIESYLEPLLYKCSLTVRLSRTFQNIHTMRAISTRIAVCCDNVTLSISEPQVSMLLRLILLTKLAMSQPKSSSGSSLLSFESAADTQAAENEEQNESWSTWIWGFVPYILPTAADGTMFDIEEDVKTLHLGIYIKDFTLDLKLVENGRAWDSFMKMKLEGCFSEMTSNTNDWMNLRLGICLITIQPLPQFDTENYVTCGKSRPKFIETSLYNKPDKGLPQRKWNEHMAKLTENALLERSPAIAIDYLSSLEVPVEGWADNFLSEPRQRILLRFVMGPLDINVTTGLLHRIEVISKSALSNEYPNYSEIMKEDSTGHASEIKYFLDTYIPQHVSQFTLCEATIRVFCAYSPSDFTSKKSKKGFNPELMSTHSTKQQPHLLLKLKCLDGTYTKPLYPEKLNGLTLRSHDNRDLLLDSMTKISAAALKLSASVLVGETEIIDMIEFNRISGSCSYNCLFFIEPDVISMHCAGQLGNINFNSTYSKLLLGMNIIRSLQSKTPLENPLFRTTLVQDSMNSQGVPFLNISINSVNAMFVQSRVNECIKLRVGNMNGSTYFWGEKAKFTIITAGSINCTNILEVVLQRPLTNASSTPFLAYVKLRQFHLNLEQTLFNWLTYRPRSQNPHTLHRWDSIGSTSRKISTSSLSSMSKKPTEIADKPVDAESIIGNATTSASASFQDFQNRTEWIMKWVSTVLSGDITDLSLTYTSTSNPGSQLVIRIPSVSISSAHGKFTLETDELPVTCCWKKSTTSFPCSVNINGVHGFSLKKNGNKEVFLETFSINCTVAVTTRIIPPISVAITVHTDTSNVVLALCKEQISVLAEVLTSLGHVLVVTSGSAVSQKIEQNPPEFKFESSDESFSASHSQTTSQPAETQQDCIKISFWLQWTLAKFSATLYTISCASSPESMKLTLEVEDVILSTDMDINDKVYQKIKIKLGTANIKHFVSESTKHPWRYGPFGGVIMTGHDSTGNDSEFMALTITRALAANYHAKISGTHFRSSKENTRCKTAAAGSYVTEVDLKLEPLDFVLAPSILGKFFSIIEPLILQNEVSPVLPSSPVLDSPINQLTTADLPLIYLDVQQIRAFMPALLIKNKDLLLNHDCVVAYLDHITLGHDTTNPISRKILRSDLYSSAQRAQVTSLPGSHLEDRQYQLEFSFQISTGKWDDLAPHITGSESEDCINPAVYWNSGQAPSHHRGACLIPLLSTVKVSLSLAPPIVTSGFVISGFNFECNFTTEVEISLNLEQLKLFNHLWNETLLVIPESCEPPTETVIDSGIESVEGSLTIPLPTHLKPIIISRKSTSMSIKSASSSTAINAKGSRHRTQTVPTDLLIIAKSVTVKLYETNEGKTQPLFYFRASHPFASLEKQGDTCVYKVSLFDLSIKHGKDMEYTNGRLDEEDFAETLIATKEGDRDPYKGIPPALFNAKSTAIGTKLPIIDIDIGRPLKFVFNVMNLNFLNFVKQTIFNTLEIENFKNKANYDGSLPEYSSRTKSKNFCNTRISSLLLSTKQIMLEFQSKDSNNRNAIFSLGTFSGQINFPGFNNTNSTFQVKSVTATLTNLNHLILNPWSFTLNASLNWESWARNAPIVNLQLTSDILAVDLSKSYFESYRVLYEEFLPVLNEFSSKDGAHRENDTLSNDENDSRSECEEQFYKDDLQAGAFQFVNTDLQPELPSAYQVVFPSASQMSWAYPQPRCITSLVVMPVPFRYFRPEGVQMSLQFLDSTGWKKWTNFTLSEIQVTEVVLPKKSVVASTWRVVILSPNAPLNVHALAASLRVDSVFNPKLVPRLTLDFNIDCCQVSFWAGPTGTIKLPPVLRRFCATDVAFIDEYPFATAFFEKFSLKIKKWKSDVMEIEGDCKPRLDVLNTRSLQEQCCVQPFQFNFTFSSDYVLYDDSDDATLERKVNIFAGPMIIYVAPPIGYTIAAAVTNSVLLSYVVCNDTCFPIRIGQAGTNEDITIHCLQCHFYSWRSSGHNMDFRFAVNLSDNNQWSKPVPVYKNGNFRLELLDENGRKMIIIVVIKKLSHIMTQILISGELIVHNNLERPIDVRLVASSIAERQRYITVNAGGRAPSVVLTPDAKYNLRLALEGIWSGLVPLYATSNSWLVKIPIQDKQDFLSVWCQIFKDKTDGGRTMVVVSPMYLIRSLLPCDANVLIKTEELQKESSVKVPGRGVMSNLFTPGTTANQHSLTFHIDGNLPSSLPHVPLSYSAMDGRTPPPPPIPEVDTLIERAELSASNVWPFLGPQWEGIQWRHANQPDTITHVKVRFCGDKLRVANSLLVELQPWALVVNTLGLNIALQSTEKFLCALHHFSVLAPPTIEGTFYLLVELNDGYHKSNGLQLSDSQSFYKPQVTGLIPVTSHIQVRVQAPNSIIYSTLHSKMVNGMRILHISASYVVANLSSYDLSVAPFAIRRHGPKIHIPSEVFSYAVSIPRQSVDVRGEPLGEWHELGHGPVTSRHLYLVFEHNGLIGAPIPVPPAVVAHLPGSDAEDRDETTLLLPVQDGPTINVCLSVVFQVFDGTTYVTIDDKPSSLLRIHNRTAHLLIVARALSQHGGAAIDEFDDWEWRFMLPGHSCGHYKVPQAAPGTPLPPVVVARADHNCSWSTAISLIPSSGSRLVNLPHSQDLSATVVKIGYTTHLILSHANHSLISASDVRSRLSLHSTNDLLLSQNVEDERNFESSPSKQKNEEIISCKDMDLLYSEPALFQFNFTIFLKGITVMLCSDPPGTFHWREVAALTLDNVGITMMPNKDLKTGAKEITLRSTVWDIQVDNQEFQQGGYDFSVVVLRQGEHDRSCFLGQDPYTLVETARNNDPALDSSIIFNLNVNPALQDVSINLAPLQLYVEDTYIFKLKEDLSNLLPIGLIRGGLSSNLEELTTELESCSNKCIQKCSPQAKESSAEFKSRLDQTKFEEEKEDFFNVSEGDDEGLEVIETWPQNTSDIQGKQENVEPLEPDSDQMLWSENPLSSDDSLNLPLYKIGIPQQVVTSTYGLSRPLIMRSLHIAPLDLLVSLHTSTKFYIALDQSPLTFSSFNRTDIVTTPYRLGHAITLHYFLGAIYGTGWALGSLQLLGAPAGLARSVGHGLRSFITLPYKGIMEGPGGFLLGVLHGSASLMKHITAGTLTSVTKLAGSWSRTLDRLTLSPQDLRFAEEMRRVKPQGLAQGIKQGLTEFGVSLLGGVGGLAQQPLEYATGEEDLSLVGSLGRGIVGVMARPLSGAAELVALTAHGILLGAGWADNHLPKHQAICQGVDDGRESRLKYALKLITNRPEKVIAVTEGTAGDYESLVLVITTSNLYIVTASSAEFFGPPVKCVALRDVIAKPGRSDPTLINITIFSPDDVAEKFSEKRIAEYVRESQLALNNGGIENICTTPPSPSSTDLDPLQLYVSPQRRDFFISLLDLAVRNASFKGFQIFGV